MTNRTDEEHDFDLVDEYIRSPAGILLERIKPVPGKAKRPDFEVLSPHGRADLGDLAAYLEFKSLWDDHFDTLVENAPEGGIVGYSGRDPAIDWIARHIRDAARQFLYVNPDRVMPNILVEVNHANPGNFGDLIEAVSGTRPHAEHESPVIWSTQPAKRLEGIAGQIDLFLWIDDTKRRRGLVGDLWSDSVPAHRRRLETVLSGLLRRGRRRARTLPTRSLSSALEGKYELACDCIPQFQRLCRPRGRSLPSGEKATEVTSSECPSCGPRPRQRAAHAPSCPRGHRAGQSTLHDQSSIPVATGKPDVQHL